MCCKSAVIDQCDGGNLQIIRADGCAFSRKVGADFAGYARGFAIKWQTAETGEQGSQNSKIGFASRALVCAVIQLSLDYIAQHNLRWRMRRKFCLGVGGSRVEVLNPDIGIRQVQHYSNPRRFSYSPCGSRTNCSPCHAPAVRAHTLFASACPASFVSVVSSSRIRTLTGWPSAKWRVLGTAICPCSSCELNSIACMMTSLVCGELHAASLSQMDW